MSALVLGSAAACLVVNGGVVGRASLSNGVALAAIQGLHQKLEAENAELRRRLEALIADR